MASKNIKVAFTKKKINRADHYWLFIQKLEIKSYSYSLKVNHAILQFLNWEKKYFLTLSTAKKARPAVNDLLWNLTEFSAS